jgi:hypothetical protein
LKRRVLLPVTAITGAYHIMTEYIGVEKVEAQKALGVTLDTRSPNLYPDVEPDVAKEALAYAVDYGVESWDGYIVALARVLDAPLCIQSIRSWQRKCSSRRS